MKKEEKFCHKFHWRLFYGQRGRQEEEGEYGSE